jgi:hypothetical protein
MAHADAAVRLREVRGRDDRRSIVGQRGTMRIGTKLLGMLPRTTHGTWHWRVTRRHVVTELKYQHAEHYFRVMRARVA